MAQKINEILRGNAYPGRGIILGRSEDNARAVAVYFIMGRSENSRNRVFEATEDGIRTRAFDEAKLTDPSLVIYHPVRALNAPNTEVHRVIITNGDQTDTIHNDFTKTHGGRGAEHGGFRRALKSRAFEPDPPILTPRISSVLDPDGGYALSILKSADGDASLCLRQFFEYDKPLAAVGHFIHTYSGGTRPDGSLESFVGEPKPVAVNLADGLEVYADEIWNALDADNRVSLYAREVNLETGVTFEVVINKNK